MSARTTRAPASCHSFHCEKGLIEAKRAYDTRFKSRKENADDPDDSLENAVPRRSSRLIKSPQKDMTPALPYFLSQSEEDMAESTEVRTRSQSKNEKADDLPTKSPLTRKRSDYLMTTLTQGLNWRRKPFNERKTRERTSSTRKAPKLLRTSSPSEGKNFIHAGDPKITEYASSSSEAEIVVSPPPKRRKLVRASDRKRSNHASISPEVDIAMPYLPNRNRQFQDNSKLRVVVTNTGPFLPFSASTKSRRTDERNKCFENGASSPGSGDLVAETDCNSTISSENDEIEGVRELGPHRSSDSESLTVSPINTAVTNAFSSVASHQPSDGEESLWSNSVLYVLTPLRGNSPSSGATRNSPRNFSKVSKAARKQAKSTLGSFGGSENIRNQGRSYGASILVPALKITTNEPDLLNITKDPEPCQRTSSTKVSKTPRKLVKSTR